MKITRNASTPSRPGSTPGNFTGVVRIDNAAMPEAPGRASTASVTFAPGAVDGVNVDWLEPVSDEQYGASTSGRASAEG